MKKLPRLFKLTSTGAGQFWEIATDGATIITTYGKVDGKPMVTKDTLKAGKNIGRTNETSPVEQAALEAQAQWEAKIKKGYVEKLDRAMKGQTDIDGGYFPMLAKKFAEDGDKIVYPALVQPKLDGHRCVADEVAALWSRTRKPINSVPHINKEVVKFGRLQLDGELYNHSLKKDFEKITHLVRQPEPTEGHEIVEYHVYDVNMPGPFQKRYENLAFMFNKVKPEHLVLVETLLVNDEEELMNVFEHFISLGYEGAIVRNANGMYVNKRSYDLQKIKEFDDAEFKIVGIEEGRGKLQGHVGKFICVTQDGVEFGAKPKGTLESLKDYFENEKSWKNKIATVQYQGMTNKNNVPRFPVLTRMRNDI
jgi:DNA ligase-1